MTVFEIYKSTIEAGSYNAVTMEERIETVYASGKITAEERLTLLNLCDSSADEIHQIDVAQKLADLDARVSVLESAGVVVWTSGHQTKRGETVLYDIIKEGKLRYCRYDGARSYTALAPGKIDGWVILASAGGEITHTVSRDADGKIILVPVENETTGD